MHRVIHGLQGGRLWRDRGRVQQLGQVRQYVDDLPTAPRGNGWTRSFYQLGYDLQGAADAGHPLQAWAAKYGIGRRTGVDIGPESAGLLPTPEWRRRTFTDPTPVMVCQFKGGIGTASRVIPPSSVATRWRPGPGLRQARPGCGSMASRSARPSAPPGSPAVRGGEAPSHRPAAGLGLDHRRRRHRRAAAPPPVRAARATRRARDRPRGRDRRPHERRPVHRLRDRQRPVAPTSGDDSSLD